MNYTQLTDAERKIIELNSEKSIKELALILKRSLSTIYRELKRNSNIEGVYNAKYASFKRDVRRCYSKQIKAFNNADFNNFFQEKYEKRYHGVEATLNYYRQLKNQKPVSISTIYRWMSNNTWVIKRHHRLRKTYVKGGKRSADYRKRLTNGNKYVFPIAMRPKYIDYRTEYGHWEIDLVIGKVFKNHDNLLTLTERKTRFTYIRRVKSKNPDDINSVLNDIINESKFDFHTITSDNGLEFRKLGLVAYKNGLIVYNAEKYCSFQRGSNEHANGLIRRTYRKTFDFNDITDDDIQKLEDEINNMPRKIFNFKSSRQMTEIELKKAQDLLDALPNFDELGLKI